MKPFMIVAALALAACAEPQPVEQAPRLPVPSLTGQTWMLDSLGGEPVTMPVTATFDGERVTGVAPCNRYFGAYTAAGERLTIDAVAATRRICPDQDLENRFLSALTDVATTAFTPAQMTLIDRDGTDLMTFIAVTN